MEQAQQLVDRYFESAVSYWDDVYRECDLAATVYQRRKEETLKWVADLRLPSDARIIDVGCGTGRTSVAVAQMGFSVCALDRVPAMLEQTQRHAVQAMVSGRIIPKLGDVSALDFEDHAFHLTVALGLLPWLGDPGQALREMLRVTRPDGYLILSSDNSCRLNYLLDPMENPMAVPLRRRGATLLRRARLMQRESAIPLRMLSPAKFRRFLQSQDLQVVREATIGFGPFTFFRQPLFSDRICTRIHRALQSLADRKAAVLSEMGAHHLVLVKRA
jgi:ubiquinone/menaquinone biosynthesis C-methylase UbiE